MRIKIQNNDIQRILGVNNSYSPVLFFDYYFSGMNIYSHVKRRKDHYEIELPDKYIEEQSVGDDVFYLAKNKKFTLFLIDDDWVFKEQSKP